MIVDVWTANSKKKSHHTKINKSNKFHTSKGNHHDDRVTFMLEWGEGVWEINKLPATSRLPQRNNL